MSTQYRKADCQSTKNVGGDKPVDPQSGPETVHHELPATAEATHGGLVERQALGHRGHRREGGDHHTTHP